MIATVRSERDERVAGGAGAHLVVRTNDLSAEEIAERVRNHAPNSIDHIVEVAFHANIDVDEVLLAPNGSIATYSTGNPEPVIPFWPLVFKNASLFFLGSDDFPEEAKLAAARSLNAALEGEWTGLDVEARYPLTSIAAAHEAVEQRTVSGRVLVTL